MLFGLVGCSRKEEQSPYGVWWWDSSLSNEYLDYADKQGINEIYYCDSNFDEEASAFIKLANKKGIKVYLLAGEYKWIEDDSELISLIADYEVYQKNNPKAKFTGIHLDIEPHQHDEFGIRRTELITGLIELNYKLSTQYSTIKFDYDIPFWFEDEITFNQETLPAYAHMIKYANRTFLMSYRDSAKGIYNVSKDEIEYAQKIGKTLILGAETYSEEGDSVSFMEEGKTYMHQELKKLKDMLPSNFGISIHHIKTWKNLQD